MNTIMKITVQSDGTDGYVPPNKSSNYFIESLYRD